SPPANGRRSRWRPDSSWPPKHSTPPSNASPTASPPSATNRSGWSRTSLPEAFSLPPWRPSLSERPSSARSSPRLPDRDPPASGSIGGRRSFAVRSDGFGRAGLQRFFGEGDFLRGAGLVPDVARAGFVVP